MTIAIIHKETKEVIFGEWDNEGLYFETQNYCIPFKTFVEAWELLEPEIKQPKIEQNLYKYRSMNTDQLKFRLGVLQREIQNNKYKVERDLKEIHRINKILNK